MMRWLLLLLFVSTGALAQPAAPPPAQARPDPASPPAARPAPPPAESIAEVGKPGWTVDERNGCWVWNPNPQIEEIVIWNGPCEGGPAQGDGLLEWRFTEAGEPRGERYVGSMARGRMHGVGTFLDAQGTVYQGEWQEGRENGLGLRVWVIGRYEGQWREGKRHGRGIMFWINGNLYRGEFREDLPEGLGEYFSVEGGWFRGTWLAGCFREGERQAAIGRPLEDCP
jgi:hypothetical protein